MLALFAATAYVPPWESNDDLSPHLTNTCLQVPSISTPLSTEKNNSSSESEAENVQSFFDISESDMATEMKEEIWKQICALTGEVLEAAVKGMMVHF